MAYFTQYSLRQLANPISDEALASLITGDDESRAALDQSGDSRDWLKWYGHEEILCGWSKVHPSTLFCLHADGEDSTGIWDKYFFGGDLIHTEWFRGLREFQLEDFLRVGLIKVPRV